MLVDRDVTAAWYHAMPAGIAQSKAGRLLNPLYLAGRSCSLSTILTGIDFAPGNPALLRTSQSGSSHRRRRRRPAGPKLRRQGLRHPQRCHYLRRRPLEILKKIASSPDEKSAHGVGLVAALRRRSVGSRGCASIEFTVKLRQKFPSALVTQADTARVICHAG